MANDFTGQIDDDVAEKFVQTAGYINQIVGYVDSVLTKSPDKFAQCVEQLYSQTKPSISIRLRLSNVAGLPETFIANLPESIMIKIKLSEGESLADTDIGSSTINIYIDPRYKTEDVLDAINEPVGIRCRQRRVQRTHVSSAIGSTEASGRSTTPFEDSLG